MTPTPGISCHKKSQKVTISHFWNSPLRRQKAMTIKSGSALNGAMTKSTFPSVHMKVLIILAAVFWALGLPATAGTNRTVAVTNTAPATVKTNDPVAKEFEQLMEEDDTAAQEIDGWIQENKKFAQQGTGIPEHELNQRIRKRLETVRSAYIEFIQQHPDHARARLAFASFLQDQEEDDAALEQMLKAKEIDPANPAVWNNLGNFYGENGPATNAFTHYEQAIRLNPEVAVYHQNFGKTLLLFRKVAEGFYHIDEMQVRAKALLQYSNAMRLAPTNFLLATDFASAHYGLKPPQPDEAIKAWNDALSLASSDLQREGVLIHLARVQGSAGRFNEAHSALTGVTNAELAELKKSVEADIEAREHPAPPPATNAPPAAVTNNPSGSGK
jgi:tetratricopeptide (TPR) repeat protein